MAREYKDSGIEWIGEIPKEWKTCQLKRLLSFQNGQDYKHVESDSGYPVYGSGGIFKYSTEYLYDGESVLFGRKGTIDKPLFVKGKFWTVDTMYYAIPLLGNDTKFLYYLATLLPFDKYQTSTALPSMTQTLLGNMNVVIPPLSEQQKIATYLDKVCGEVDEMIVLQEQMIEELKAYKQSVITEAVTKGLNPNSSMKDSGIEWIGEIPEHWEIKKIGYIFDNLDYLREPISAELRERNNPRYDYYGASGVIDKIDHYNVEDKVLLIGEDGANLVMRNLPLVYKAEGKFWVNNHAHILKPIKDDYNYMAHTLEAADYRNYITGFAQPKLSQENLKAVKLPIPPLSEQQAIASYLDTKCSEIDALIAIKQQKIEELKDYKKSVIYEYVTGKKEVN